MIPTTPKRAFATGGRLLCAAALTALVTTAQAAVYQWNTLGPITSNWSTASNWQGALTPAASNNTDTVRFFANNYGVLMTGNVTANMDLGAPRVMNQLILSGRGGSAARTVQLNGGALQLAGTSPSIVLEASAGAGAITYDVYNAIQIPAATAITGPGYGIANLRGPFSGAGSLAISAQNTQLTLYSASTYTGSTSISSGTVYLAANNALPAATDLTINAGATLDLNVRWGGGAGANQTLASLSGAGTVTNNNNSVTRTLTINGSGDSVFAGSITAGSGATPNTSRLNVVKTGSGTLTLTGASNYTGTTTVSGGTLVVDGSLASSVTVSGSGRLGGAGTLGGGLTFAAGTRLAIEIADAAGTPGSGWDRTQIGGALNITATASTPVVIDLAGSGPGDKAANFIPGKSYQWTILTAAGGITGFSADRFAVDTTGFTNAFVEQNLPHGAFSVEQSGNDIRLVYLPAALPNLAVYKGALATRAPDVRAFERWLGRPVNRVYDGIAWQNSWTAWRNAVNHQTTSTNYSWVNVPTRYRANFSVAMLPSDTGSGATNMAAGASGAYNSHWTYLAEKLVETGQGDAIIRMGWEMNLANGSPAGLNHWKWTVSNSTQATHYINYWRQIVDTMRAVPGANFLFDFCPGNGWGVYPAINSYPGDDYVDIIGLDVYNVSFTNPKPGPMATWDTLVGNSGNYSMLYWRDFAVSRGKFTSFPEWGTGIRPNDNWGNGDDPHFIKKMHQWIADPANNVLYHTYWDYQASDFLCQISNNQYPASAAMFKALFGQAEYWDRDIGVTPVPGDSTYDATSKVHTVRGSGAGLGGTSDSFHFTFTPKMGDTEIIARVTGIQNTDTNAVFGVMIREDMSPGARFAFAGVTRGGVARFQHRSTANAAAATPYTASSVALPLWVKITRVGDVFTAYRSANGTTWTNIGSQTIAMAENAYIGLALAGVSTTQRNVATADNVNEPFEVVVDNLDAGAVFTGTWNTGTPTGNGNGPAYNGNFRASLAGLGSAVYTPDLPESGNYDVYIWYTYGDNRPVNAPLVVNHAGGATNLSVSQRFKTDGWVMLGTFNFNSGTSGNLTFNTAGAVDYLGTPRGVIADAVRFVKTR